MPRNVKFQNLFFKIISGRGWTVHVQVDRSFLNKACRHKTVDFTHTRIYAYRLWTGVLSFIIVKRPPTLSCSLNSKVKVHQYCPLFTDVRSNLVYTHASSNQPRFYGGLVCVEISFLYLWAENVQFQILTYSRILSKFSIEKYETVRTL